ncbi:MAG: 23S rRNA (uracil(1939)-C(5))-methyltransferase RlmD [Peptococcaceae bacterium]|nr:23S rRNA (uracil(1939)-C(5))-methyltransferase RlmD [Peptococcaceae bacterium]
MKNKEHLEINDRIDLLISGIAHNGDGVGRWQGQAIFVPGALPGESVSVQIIKTMKKYARGKLIMINSSSPHRAEPPCPHYYRCGGCHWQHVEYCEHLNLKTEIIENSLSHIAGIKKISVLESIGMDYPWHYRNKVHFQIEAESAGYKIGFFEKESHKLISIFGKDSKNEPGCLLIAPELNLIAANIEALINKYRPDKVRRENPFFKGLILRKAFATGEIMAIIITDSKKWTQAESFTESLTASFPEITSLIRKIDSKTSPVKINKDYLLYGKNHITDKLGDLSVKISANSFYQVNPLQALNLYKKTSEYIDISEQCSPIIVDAYSGTGTIAMFLADSCKKILAIEENPAAVDDARDNALINRINNIEFYLGKVEQVLPTLIEQNILPDILILDPPRSGCHQQVIESAAASHIPRIIYISCNPVTLARDLALFSADGYRITKVQPIDMFPWTMHTESVVLLSRSKGTTKAD